MGSFVLINDVNMTYLAHKYGFGPHPMNKIVLITSLIHACRERLKCLKPANNRRYEGGTYNFETLVPFKVIPLSLDAPISALLLQLETLPKILQRKFCQGPPAILIGPLQCQQNASFSNPASSMGTKNGARSGKLVWWGTTTILFLAKNCWMLKSVW